MSGTVYTALKESVRNAVLAFGGTSVSLLIWFTAKILIVRAMTKEDFGIYSFVLALANISFMFSGLWLREGVTRFISIYLGEGKKELAGQTAISGLQTGLLLSLVSGLFIFSFPGFISGGIFNRPELERPLRIISLSIPFAVTAHIAGAVLRGYNNIRPKVYCLDVGQPLTFLVLIIFIYPFKLHPENVLLAYTLSIIIMFFVMEIYRYNKLRFSLFLIKKKVQADGLISFSIPLFAEGIVGIVLAWTDILVLGRYAGIEDVGAYSVSASLAMLLTLPLGALNYVFVPIAGAMYAKGSYDELKRVYQVLTKWVLAATLPIFCMFFIFPEAVISFVFGKEYIVSAIPLRLLSLGFLVQIMLGALFPIMIIYGMSKTIMNISALGALLNIVLNYILIKKLGYGIMGAAVATMVTHIFMNCTSLLLVYKKCGVQPFTSKYMRPMIGIFLTSLIVYGLSKVLPLHFWMIPLYLIVFASGCIFSLFLTKSLDSEDLVIFAALIDRAGLKTDLLKKVFHRYGRNGKR